MPDIDLSRSRDIAGINALEDCHTGSEAQPWTAEFLRYDREESVLTGPLAQFVASLAPAAPAFDLDYLLAFSKGVSCSPLIVPVRYMGNFAGVVFASQRHTLGKPIGIVSLGHFCGDDFLAARNGARRSVLATALSILATDRRVHTLRAWIKQGDSLAAVFENVPGMVLTREPTENRDLLKLGTSFDAFVRTLGRQTRHNVRYYRRRAKLNGWRCVESLSPNEIEVALGQLAAHQRTSHVTYWRLARFVDAVKKMPSPVFMGMQTPDGKWLSMVIGWRNGHRGHIILQLNRRDAEYDGASLSLVLRAHAIESLMACGVREVRVVGGCEGTLKRYCEPTQYELLTLKKTGWRPNLFLGQEQGRQLAGKWFGAAFGVIGTLGRKRTIKLLLRRLLPQR